VDFNEFFAELGPRPEGCSIDRINPLGHYEPGNVRWATRQQQVDQFCAYVVGIPYASDNFTKEEFERFQVCVNSLD